MHSSLGFVMRLVASVCVDKNGMFGVLLLENRVTYTACCITVSGHILSTMWPCNANECSCRMPTAADLQYSYRYSVLIVLSVHRVYVASKIFILNILES